MPTYKIDLKNPKTLNTLQNKDLTLKDCAKIFNVSESTINRHRRELNVKIGFRELELTDEQWQCVKNTSLSNSKCAEMTGIHYRTIARKRAKLGIFMNRRGELIK